MALARARITAGDIVLKLPFNPSTISWDYEQVIQSYDTLGGRVVQLLAVRANQMTLQAVAGSRSELLNLQRGIKDIMRFHIQTQRPAELVVPSRKWHFAVYVTAMPQIGWEVSTVSYPFQLNLAIEEDLGTAKEIIGIAALQRLARGIGYNPKVHGGDPSGFHDLVERILSAYSASGGAGTTAGSGTGRGGATGGNSGVPGTEEQWNGKGKWPPKIANAPWRGATLRDQIKNCFSAVFGDRVGQEALCIVQHESSFDPRAINSYVSGGVRHWVYGLFQISDVHRSRPWWPSSTSGTNGGLMFDPEYNTRCAMHLYDEQGWNPWSTKGLCL